MEMLYFDHNATAPLHPVAAEAWIHASNQFVGNPSSLHRLGRRADTALENARGRLAAVLGCDASQIIWTSGATESNNLALHHLAAKNSQSEAWISEIEHPSVLETAMRLFKGRFRTIPVNNLGAVDPWELERELRRYKPAVVAMMSVNNVTGVLQPWRRIRKCCDELRIPYLCDSVQWMGRLPSGGLGFCDWVTGCAHKAGGPRGIGFLKCPEGAKLKPLIHGGPQEGGHRAGTENVAGALALVAALEQRESLMEQLPQRGAMRDRFIASIRKRLPGVEVVGDGETTLWNTVALLMPETECPQRWAIKLDKLGFAVSTGSACSSGREEPSPVLLAMGYPPEKASRMLRISSGWETTEEEWMRLADGICTAATDLGVPVANP